MSMNLFTIPANDQSIFYLGQIFGNIGGVLPVTNGPLLLSVMFKVLNTAALSVGAMIVVYTTVAGLLSTASEGEFLGKKWSGLWVPVRTVLGIAGLFPSSGGYCAIQVIIMWLILQGVGLADTLWTTVLVFMEKNGGSPYASVPFPDIKSGTTQALQKLFTGLVCFESLAAKYQVKGVNKNPYLCGASSTDIRCNASLPVFDPAALPKEYNLDPSGATASCSYLQFCDSTVPTPASMGESCENVASTKCINALKKYPCYNQNSLGCQLCKAQIQVLPGIISVFDSIAKQFVQLDYEYQNFYNSSNIQTVNQNQVPLWIQNYCNSAGAQNKCCVNGMSPDTDDPRCDSGLFNNFPANGSHGVGSVDSNTLSRLYVPYGLLPYTNDVDFINAAANQYMSALSAAYVNYITALPPTQLAGWQLEAKNNGWILAGMYYFKIARANSTAQVNMGTLPVFVMAAQPDPVSTNSAIKNNRNNINVMGSLFTALSKAGADDALSGMSSPGVAEVADTIGGTTHSMLASFMNDVTGRSQLGGVIGKLAENPLYRISAYGYSLMISTQLLFWGTATALSLVAGLASINFEVAGTGMTTSPGYEAAKAIWGTISPFWILMLSVLFSIGAILGIYLPLIPYTIFIMGAVGWLMATIEAMVAGPLIALGILSPSGQHELLGKSEPAVMIIFNLILRPSLMVFGMMASMFLAVVAVTIINQGFAKVAFDIISAPGLVEGIVFMMAYTSLLMMVLNKVFSLIHVVPEKVLTYIGGQAISYGESEGLAGMKQALEGGAGAMAGGGKEAGGSVQAGITKVRQDDAHQAGDVKGGGVHAKTRKPTGLNDNK